jgi:PAS domain S-box-containing protein
MVPHIAFEAIVNSARDLISIHESDGAYSYASPYFQKVLGYGGSELLGESFLQHVHPDDRVRVKTKTKEAITTGKSKGSIEYRMRCHRGEYLWMQSRLSVVEHDGNKSLLNEARELSKVKEDERLIAQSEASMRVAELVAKMGSWRVNMETMQNWWSEGNFHIYGMEVQERPPSVDYILKERLHSEDGPVS